MYMTGFHQNKAPTDSLGIRKFCIWTDTMGYTYDGLNFSSVQTPAIINNEHSPNVN